MTMKQHEYAFIDHAENSENLGSAWWDGTKVCTSGGIIDAILQETHVFNLTQSDGIEYLDALPDTFRSGYLAVKKVR